MFCAGHRGKFFALFCVQTFCYGSALQSVIGTRVTIVDPMVISSFFFFVEVGRRRCIHYSGEGNCASIDLGPASNVRLGRIYMYESSTKRWGVDQHQARSIPGRCGENEGHRKMLEQWRTTWWPWRLVLMLLKMKQYTSCEGGTAPPRPRNPFMETIRLRGLDPPSGETMDDTSFSNILTAWSNGRWYFEGDSTFTQHEDMGASRSESSCSLSPDLGETWAYGCPKSPTCGSQSDFEESSEVRGHSSEVRGHVDEDENLPYLLCGKVVDRMPSVLDCAPWSYIRAFLELSDTFCMRSVATIWNIAAKFPTLTENSCFLDAQRTWWEHRVAAKRECSGGCPFCMAGKSHGYVAQYDQGFMVQSSDKPRGGSVRSGNGHNG